MASLTASRPRPGRQTHAERTDRSDRRMLDAAVELIVANGPEKTTLKEVGERAGYSRGLAGYRFGSKQGLFEFVLRSVGEQWLQQLTIATDRKSGLAAMRAAIHAHHRFLVADSERMRAFYILWFNSAGPESETKNIVLGIDARRREDVATWVSTANLERPAAQQLDACAVAGQFGAAIVGIAYHWLAHPDDHTGVKRLHDELIHTMALHMNQGSTA